MEDRHVTPSHPPRVTPHPADRLAWAAVLGLSEMTIARPIQAALTSAATFAVGAAMPLAMVLLMQPSALVLGVSVASLLFLALLGAIGDRAGGANLLKATLRVTFRGAPAMALTATGCSIEIGTNADGKLVTSRGVGGADVNHGKLCLKGIFEYEVFEAQAAVKSCWCATQSLMISRFQHGIRRWTKWLLKSSVSRQLTAVIPLPLFRPGKYLPKNSIPWVN